MAVHTGGSGGMASSGEVKLDYLKFGFVGCSSFCSDELIEINELYGVRGQ